MMNKMIVLACLVAMVAGSEWVWTGDKWEWQEKKDTESVGDISNKYSQTFGQGQGGVQRYLDSDTVEGSGGSDYDDDDDYDDEDYGDYNYDDEFDSKPIRTTPSPRIIPSGQNSWSSDDEDFVEGSGDFDDQIIVKEKEPVTSDDKGGYIFDDKKENEIYNEKDSDIYVESPYQPNGNNNWITEDEHKDADQDDHLFDDKNESDVFYDKGKDSDIYDEKDSDKYNEKDSDIYVESTYQPNGNNNWITEEEHKDADQAVHAENTNNEDDITDDTVDDYKIESTDNKGIHSEVPIKPDADIDDNDDDTVDFEVVHTDNKGVYNEVPIKPVDPNSPPSTTPSSSPEINPYKPYKPIFGQPGIMAAVIGGAVVGLLCAILLVMFIVYRMRKKDEGSYALDEPKRSHNSNSYSKPPSREFYA